MKGMGPKEERETIIRFDEANKMASIWTASFRIYRKLLKKQWKLIEDDERHAVFEALTRYLTLRNPTKVRQVPSGTGFQNKKGHI